MIPSGDMTQLFELQRPTNVRNDAGEVVTTWTKVRTIRGSYEAQSYAEASRRGQLGSNLQATVIVRYFDGVDGTMRLLWKSNGDRVLMISAAVPVGLREDLELTVEERRT